MKKEKKGKLHVRLKMPANKRHKTKKDYNRKDKRWKNEDNCDRG